MANLFNWTKISCSDLLYKECKKDTNIGKKIIADLNNKSYAKDEYVIDLIKKEIAECEREHKSWILEGFPRTKF